MQYLVLLYLAALLLAVGVIPPAIGLLLLLQPSTTSASAETKVVADLSNSSEAGSGLLHILLACVYPTILLFLANTRSWKRTLRHEAAYLTCP